MRCVERWSPHAQDPMQPRCSWAGECQLAPSSPTAQGPNQRGALGGAAFPMHNALSQRSGSMFGSFGNFHVRKLPAFPELQAMVSVLNLSCTLLCAAVCGFWYFPLMISVCHRLLGSNCGLWEVWDRCYSDRTACRSSKLALMGHVVVPPTPLCLPTQGLLLVLGLLFIPHHFCVLKLTDEQDGSLNLALLRALFNSPEVLLTSAGSI